MEQDNSAIAWHTAFIEAIQLELGEYKDFLEFHSELQLTSEPLKIDCVIIKKVKNVVIKKNIAAIFRNINLIEYKSPADYVSIADFYKVYAYACLYASINNVPVTSLTLTFVESHYPRKLIEHLIKVRGYTVEEKSPGIYTVIGDILPIQLIDNRQLSAEENLWLKNLNNCLDPLAVLQISEEADRQSKAARIKAYMSVLAKANYKAIEEAIKMSSPAKSLDEVLERTGLAARWEERKAFDIAKNMVNLGYSAEAVITATQLESEKVKALYEEAK